jgi:hypothetical protein
MASRGREVGIEALLDWVSAPTDLDVEGSWSIITSSRSTLSIPPVVIIARSIQKVDHLGNHKWVVVFKIDRPVCILDEVNLCSCLERWGRKNLPNRCSPLRRAACDLGCSQLNFWSWSSLIRHYKESRWRLPVGMETRPFMIELNWGSGELGWKSLAVFVPIIHHNGSATHHLLLSRH